MVELQLPKLVVRVRFPSLAPPDFDVRKNPDFYRAGSFLTGDFSAQ